MSKVIISHDYIEKLVFGAGETTAFLWHLELNKMDAAIQRIFESGVVNGRSGKRYKLDYSVDIQECEFLDGIIRHDSSVVNTLEVGCAYGMSSLVICSAIHMRPGASHTIIDPFQRSDWDEVGIRNLELNGLDCFTLLEQRSEFSLPRLLEEGEGRFDFVFVDGWHTLDHTFIDCFYATRLLRVGGYLVIDDVGFPSVRGVVDHLANYPCYEVFGTVPVKKRFKVRPFVLRYLMSPVRRQFWAKALSASYNRWIFEDVIPDMVALKKVAEDARSWNWHNEVPDYARFRSS